MTKKLATFNLSEETIKKLEEITMTEIIMTGKMVNKSSILRNMITKKYNQMYDKKNGRQ